MQKKNSAIKTVKESITWKVIMYFLLFVGMGIGIELSFLCMNTASTFAFIMGIVLFIISIGIPVEVIVHNVRKKIKGSQSE